MSEEQGVEGDAAKSAGTRRGRAASGLRHEGRRVLGAVELAEDLVHYLIALLLVTVAIIVLVHAVADFVRSRADFATRVTGVINGVLFVIIVMEILRTVVAHFDDAGLQLKPFLIIGIISAVRHILTVGAQVSLGHGEGDAMFRRAQTELGVNAAVVVALVLGLVLVWRSEREGSSLDGSVAESADTKGPLSG